jgi:calcineurin-like phosphoesterase family protein
MTKVFGRFEIMASFSALASFCGISLALTESAFGYHLAAAGDWGCNNNTEKTVRSITSKNPTLLLDLGDNSYQPTADCWLAITHLLDGKMKIAIGNHDDVSSSLLNQYLSHFNLSREYYSFNYLNAHFVVLSTEQKGSSSQYDFVKSDLARASSNSSIDWIIVYMHKPLYTSPNNHTGDSTMRDRYHPLFDQYGVDIALYGHNHAYERSYPMKYQKASPSIPIITNSSKGNYTDPQGEIFATVGTAGESIYHYKSKSQYIVTQYEGYGFLDIDIARNKLVAKFYSDIDGSVEDQFTITKNEHTSSI